MRYYLAIDIGASSGRLILGHLKEGRMVLETVKLAAVVRSTYCGDGHRFDQAAGTHWYDTYLDYAVAQGILTREQFPELDRTATRSEAAFLLFHALPETELPQRSTLSPPDVTLEAPY